LPPATDLPAPSHVWPRDDPGGERARPLWRDREVGRSAGLLPGHGRARGRCLSALSALPHRRRQCRRSGALAFPHANARRPARARRRSEQRDGRMPRWRRAPRPHRGLRRRGIVRRAFVVLLWLICGLLVAAPWLCARHQLSILTELFIFGLLALSLDLIMGYTGMVSFGHAAYFGLGAYAGALTLLTW